MSSKTTPLAAVALVGLWGASAGATDIGAKKMKLRTADTSKQQVQIQSKDPLVDLPTGADRPTVNGASLHVYGANGLDFCFTLDASSWEDKGTSFKFKDAAKNSAQVKEDKLKVKVKGVLGIPAATTKNPVNAVFRSGAGLLLCMRCSSPKKDVDGKYDAKDCAAVACDAEPSSCTPPLPVSFAADVQPIYTSRCAIPVCHAGGFPAQGLNLSAGQAYAETVNVPSTECITYDLVEPGSPALSYLMFKVQGSGPCFMGSPMPASGPPLSAGEIQTISDWISQGALNN